MATRPLVLCDLTQSYSPSGGGGITTYLREKARHVLEQTPHTLVQMVPGPADLVRQNGRHVWIEIGANPVRGSPNYRFITRRAKVRQMLERYRPDLIESLCPWFLPWTAIYYRRSHPETTLVAGYRTDFPSAQVERVVANRCGAAPAWAARKLSLGYLEITYREFDRVYALNEASRQLLKACGCPRTDRLDLGVDLARFHPGRRDPSFRAELGLGGDGPLLVYAGRLDNEKRADLLVEMMRRLPARLEAGLVLIGDGKLRERLEGQCRAEGLPVAFPGYLGNRDALARALASADIYVSAMAHETFGVSVIEAQASGLPVVGVAAGAMRDRVPPGLGLLGPVGDAEAMAANVLAVWRSDHRAMGLAAAAHVRGRYSWQATFETLLGEIYPRARAHTRLRLKRQRKGALPNPVAALEAWLVEQRLRRHTVDA